MSEKEKEKTVKVYHYTSDEGLAGIEKDRKIKQSTDTRRDALLGKGTYVTKMDPSNNSRTQIASNNYDGALSRGEREAKVKNVISVDVPVRKLASSTNGRDVHKYDGDIDLNDSKYSTKKYNSKTGKYE